jgi:hypothetical protein
MPARGRSQSNAVPAADKRGPASLQARPRKVIWALVWLVLVLCSLILGLELWRAVHHPDFALHWQTWGADRLVVQENWLSGDRTFADVKGRDAVRRVLDKIHVTRRVDVICGCGEGEYTIKVYRDNELISTLAVAHSTHLTFDGRNGGKAELSHSSAIFLTKWLGLPWSGPPWK